MYFHPYKCVVSFLEFISFKLEKILKQFFEDAGEWGKGHGKSRNPLSHLTQRNWKGQIKLFITFGININCFQKGNSYRMVDVSVLSGQ